MYDYNSTDDRDLTFCAGDVIVVREMNGEWWTGSIGDRSGMFPSNYVAPLQSQVICHHLTTSLVFTDLISPFQGHRGPSQGHGAQPCSGP